MPLFFHFSFVKMIMIRYAPYRMKGKGRWAGRTNTIKRVVRVVRPHGEPWGYVNRRVGGVLGLEKKYFDSAHANILATAFASGQFSPLTLNTLYAPVQGTGPNDRTGTRSLIHSLHMKFEYKTQHINTTSSARSDPTMYYALVLDKQCNGVQAATSDIWDTPASNQQDLLPFRKIENQNRFRVLTAGTVSCRVNLVNNGSTTDAYALNSSRRIFQINKSFPKPIVVRHIANGGTIGDIAENSLQFYCWGRDSAHQEILNYQCRVRFTG